MGAILHRPQDIIVFMVGGTTYEEARAVALLNQQLIAAAAAAPGGGGGSHTAPRIILGGTCMHNSQRCVHPLLYPFAANTDGPPRPFFCLSSFLSMVEESSTRFPPSFYSPPPTLSSVPSPAPPPTSSAPSQPISLTLPSFSTAPTPTTSPPPPPPPSNSAINLRLGNYEVGTGGLYRTAGPGTGGATLSIDSERVREGLTNGLAGASAGLAGAGAGALGLLERVRLGVEARRQASQGGQGGGGA